MIKQDDLFKLLRKLLGKYLINGNYLSPAVSSDVENGLKKTKWVTETSDRVSVTIKEISKI